MRRFQAAHGSLTYDPKGSQQKDHRMSLDDFVVSSQHMIDRAIRRFRRGEPPARTQRRLLIVQIDDLSRAHT
jgi:hypothetical protein